MPGETAGKQRCVVLQYDEATWTNGTVNTYGKLVLKTRMPGRLGEFECGARLADEPFVEQWCRVGRFLGARDASLDGTKKVLTFSPVAGSYSGGKPITSNVTTTFTARNVKATNPAHRISVCR